MLLTKTMNAPQDYAELAQELAVVDKHFGSASPQHEARRWEYSLALRAMEMWPGPTGERSVFVADVGGAGSPLYLMVHEALEGINRCVEVVDPASPRKESLAQYRQALVAEKRLLPNVVLCVSVLEHIPIPEYEQFLQDLADVTAPGGLLFLTMDIKGDEEPGDNKHFAGMRTHIYTPASWKALADKMVGKGFNLLGEADWAYHGDMLFGGPSGYSFASIALVKKV